MSGDPRYVLCFFPCSWMRPQFTPENNHGTWKYVRMEIGDSHLPKPPWVFLGSMGINASSQHPGCLPSCWRPRAVPQCCNQPFMSIHVVPSGLRWIQVIYIYIYRCNFGTLNTHFYITSICTFFICTTHICIYVMLDILNIPTAYLSALKRSWQPSHNTAHLNSLTKSNVGRWCIRGMDPNYSTLPETNSSPLKIDPGKRRFLLETTIFRGYVRFREGISKYLDSFCSTSCLRHVLQWHLRPREELLLHLDDAGVPRGALDTCPCYQPRLLRFGDLIKGWREGELGIDFGPILRDLARY